MFVHGMRHVLDPVHIACIDCLTWRALNHEQQHAHWTGILSAIAIAIAIAIVHGLFVFLSTSPSAKPCERLVCAHCCLTETAATTPMTTIF